ncbi:hypothetical protein MUN89_07005 [Halobacillus salinarum]|uniref:Uncharacterized protein n=1 Tax=Halobacillus salinarum TaxID=2932257 RepID=A0ABY4ENM9_9BACI|nr:hypothetical protein [Halobacillus salinarum]UOQ45676.1 hypothetical protein MUN89_07005 [Halobacillus salinarum]
MERFFEDPIILAKIIKKYGALIASIIQEMGIIGKKDDFMMEGARIAAKESFLYNLKEFIVSRDDYIDYKIREHFRRILEVPEKE